MTAIIDAHQHYWKTAAQEQPWREAHHAGLERDFEPEHLDPLLATAGIAGTVVMQSVDEPAENDRLAAYAAHPTVAGVVSWLPVRRPSEAMIELDRLTIPKHVGVRCLVADDPMDWLHDREVLALFQEVAARGLAWDTVPITAAQVANVTALAAAVPDLRVVVDHLGRPPIDTAGWEPWATNMAGLAALPNTFVKVSIGINVLSAWERWDAAAVAPYIAEIVRLFSADRLMLASNWPVVLLRTDYETAWQDLATQALALEPTEHGRRSILGGTATRVYGLERFAAVARSR
ncbi:amidohydrolase family protein [Microbacterium sp. 10M-3C3]|uniref:amidohydrolase family protein n=1 Tax=Microbacterium sp. 10M-3C3 TaxID=2483401 RepID=UPI0013DDEE4A|nr:amidohydrolase family protein [Microbacterium sp. 10M-3C3]